MEFNDHNEPQIEVREEIIKFIKRSLPSVAPAKVEALTDYLLGDSVMCGSLTDLKDVPASDFNGFIGSAQIAKLKRKIDELPGDDEYLAPEPPAKRVASQSRPGTSRTQDDHRFVYKIDWTVVGLSATTALEEAENSNQIAPPEALKQLKLALAKDCKVKYGLHRAIHPGLNKHPGVSVYNEVADKVILKYPTALRIDILGKTVSNGRDEFYKLFKNCIENQSRSEPKSATPKRNVKISRRNIGVLPDKYAPQVCSLAPQESIRKYLQTLHDKGRESWDFEEIKELSLQVFPLMREEINEANDNVQLNGDKVPLQERALSKLIDKWPFLKESFFLETHFKELTGYSLTKPVEEFLNREAQNYVQYMTSAPNCPVVKNLRIKMKTDGMEMGLESSLFPILKMIANCFNEDVKKGLIQEIEKTTHDEEIHSIVKDMPPFPYLISKGPMDNAQSFHIFVDQVQVAAAVGPVQALASLFAQYFVLGCDYPSDFKSTLEVIERVIFKMTVAQLKSQPTRRGEVVVISTAVKIFIEKHDAFLKELNQLDEEETDQI